MPRKPKDAAVKPTEAQAEYRLSFDDIISIMTGKPISPEAEAVADKQMKEFAQHLTTQMNVIMEEPAPLPSKRESAAKPKDFGNRIAKEREKPKGKGL